MNGPRIPGFPGGTAVSHLRVYDWPAADGLAGGSPHLHTASAEGYVVLRGEGFLETLSGAGFQRTPLRPGSLLWFTPGTVHRLVNDSGDLEILVVMQNAGLPEAGDAVLTYPGRVLADPDAYRRATVLPQAVTSAERAARERRDLAVQGYLELRERVESEGPGAMRGLYRAATELVRERAAGWHHHVERGAVHQARTTRSHLEALGRGDGTHLEESAVYGADVPSGPLRNGMCGHLRVWDLDGAARID
ncbi:MULTISPECIES: cupin domain-containing protein [unclassified Nocardiopsis]|uniref:cupin domain-containing protein n=1 Tax=unclassified Nocardiopsis TaxID=2649073 RepID=UPI00135CC03F|nr:MULTISPECIES: cupin domain-containing protein [unclassified Nocardiopsis]